MDLKNNAPQAVQNLAWIRYRSAGYLRGRGFSFGCNEPIYPQQAIDGGKYSVLVDIVRNGIVDVCDSGLGVFAPRAFDHCFLAPRVMEVPQLGAFLNETSTKLADNAHLIVHLPEAQREKFCEALAACGQWQTKDSTAREGVWLGIFKLVARSRTGILPLKPRAPKRACIARYGAIGDMIMVSPLIRKLHEDGYEVTLNITPYCAEILKHNPYISNIILQERDVVPNQELGPYWKEWAQEYDRYINLSESIEGKLLKVEGRRDFFTTKKWRNDTCGSVNYYDHTMALGGYPGATGLRGELFFSRSEEKGAQFVRQKFADKFLILWALKGSSHHKQYPLLKQVFDKWLATRPDVHVMLVGSEADAKLGWEVPQVTNLCGKIPLREVLALCKVADLVGGPETAIMNAAACFDTPKLVLLSHSSHENFCKYYTNHTCLAPASECHPCNQLHYNSSSCPLIQLTNPSQEVFWQGPACAGVGVSPERLEAALTSFYSKQ